MSSECTSSCRFCFWFFPWEELKSSGTWADGMANCMAVMLCDTGSWLFVSSSPGGCRGDLLKIPVRSEATRGWVTAVLKSEETSIYLLRGELRPGRAASKADIVSPSGGRVAS